MFWRISSGFQKFCCVVVATFAFSGFAAATPSWAETDGTNIVVSQAAAPILFGVHELQRTLQTKGLKVGISSKKSSSGVQVVITTSADNQSKSLASTHPPAGPESYSISVVPPNTIFVEGSDPVGAMYGAMDLAEQVDWASGRDYLSQIKQATKSPYLSLRGVNMFLVVQDIEEPNGAFWSD